MLDLVPFILNEEKARIRKEIEGKFIAVIFDGTSHLGEVLAVVLRFISEWTIQQRLVRLQFLVKNGEEIARELINILSVTLGIQSHLVLAAMRDRASVNNLAMRTVKVIYPNILDVGCFPHTLDIVGEKFNTPTLNTFPSHWISLFSHSPKSKALWKEQTGRAKGTLSKTRWWSRWEILNQLLLQLVMLSHFYETMMLVHQFDLNCLRF